MALKDIKNKIKATQRTNKVTRAMEAVSAVKMRKTQATALADRPYARAALQILARLSGSADIARHPLAAARPVAKTILVVITSDKGLAGALNSSVLKRAAEMLAELPLGSVEIYAYGKKGEEYFRHRDFKIIKAVANKADDVAISTLEELSTELATRFSNGECDQVLAVYSNFKSTFEQAPVSTQLLPLSVPILTGLINEIAPARGKYSDQVEISSPPVYTVESASGKILDVLLPRLVAASLYHMLLESKASEHSARMVAMKNASDKSKEVAHDLTRLFNKIRQAAITREVSEIVGGREALAA